MAEWALRGDPDAKLYLNDYDVLISDSPLGIGLPEYMAHIRNLLKQGVPIAGIKGLFTLPAFYGKYKVTVNGISKEVDLTKREGRVIVDFRKQNQVLQNL